MLLPATQLLSNNHHLVRGGDLYPHNVLWWFLWILHNWGRRVPSGYINQVLLKTNCLPPRFPNQNVSSTPPTSSYPSWFIVPGSFRHPHSPPSRTLKPSTPSSSVISVYDAPWSHSHTTTVAHSWVVRWVSFDVSKATTKGSCISYPNECAIVCRGW